jgi:O-antigen/teichoic acid export membrane protein
MHEKRVARTYSIELMTALAVYTVLLFSAIHFGRPMPEGWLRTLVLVTPMIGFGMMIRTIARHVARIDEYQRIRLLENIAVAAAITLAGTFTYGFLETAGFPKVSMFYVWIAMGVSTAAVTLFRKWTDR